MTELLHEFSVFLRYCKKEILHNHRVKSANRRTDGNNSSYIKKDDGTIFNRNHIIEQRSAFGGNVCFAKHLTDCDRVDDSSVSPIIVSLYVEFSIYQYGDKVHMFALTKDIFTFFILMQTCIKAREHCADFFFGNSCK